MGYSDAVNVAVVNFRDVWGNKAYNLNKILDTIDTAAKQGAQIIVFPEMALTGYSNNQTELQRDDKMQRRLAETVPGPSTEAVAALTKKLGVYVAFGMAELDPLTKEVFNAAAVCGPDGIIGSYRKIHPALQEACWADAGEKPFLFDTPWGPVGVGICYDTYCFPELMRYYCAKGARLYLNVTCVIRNNFDWMPYFDCVLRSNVVVNELFIATSNLTGNEFMDTESGGCEVLATPMASDFAGGSSILGPGMDRRVQLYAGDFLNRDPQVFLANLDLSMAHRTLYKVDPFVGRPDFRPEVYEKMYRELAEK